ncbi:MAG TPA: type II toxin-antitoxin system RelE/ParE family toxin [Candidatus Tyrphobacter sp.]
MSDQERGEAGSGRFAARYYRAPDGAEPVNDFIEKQKAAVQLAIDRKIELLNMLDEKHPHLAFPHSSQVEGEMRELRCHYGRTLYRILYRRRGTVHVLLHVFEKRSDTIPEADKKIARERWRDFEKRMSVSARKAANPLGKRAPGARRS